MSSFVHLHVHTEYSLLEACVNVKSLVQKASDLGMSACSITDNGNMFGAVDFYLNAKSKGLNGIIGLDAYIAPNGRFNKNEDKDNRGKVSNRRLVLLAQNYSGYQNLCKISTIGYQEGFYYKPRIDYEVLEKHSDNLIALSGGLRGDIGIHFFDFGAEKALEKIRYYKNIFGDRFYLELQRTGIPEWKEYEKFLLEASKITGVQLVATNEVFYLEKADSFAQEVLMCIGSNKTLQDETRLKMGTEQYYFKSSDQMRDLFSDLPDLCDRTIEIASRCKTDFKLKDESGKTIYHLPSFPTEQGRDLKDEIYQKSLEGLEKRFDEAKLAGQEVFESEKQDYYKRLDYEVSVIDNMGFSGYFLIVQDFINWAKNNDIPVGPGRGSGAGSIVAYSLRITDLDPIKNKLIFERFLNPERVSMPDFDVDFCQDRRGEVINYVTQKYGSDCVSQIITFGKLQARAAVRDVGRVMGMSFSEVDVVSKLIPEKLGITLEEALKLEPRITEMMEQEPRIRTLLDIAQRIEGQCRHASIHAAGVIISNQPLVTYAPLYKGVEGENVVQYDMKVSEKIGLIKFDFLGLKTLTHVNNTVKLIEKNQNKKILPQEIRMDDPGIYEIMTRGDTGGIFQFEGDGITDFIKRLKPNCFEDIVAVTALFRPGPMQMIDEYIARKHGQIQVKYIFKELEEVLKETYGIIVYQEQVQLIASRIASYSLGEADLLRRAMGKKIKEEMDQQRARFLKGAIANGYDKGKSEDLFDLMAKFAEYGFNKSHAAAYCVITGQTAWLKNYYPVEFYAALLSTELSDTDKIVKYIKEARKRGIQVEAPSVNNSEHIFTVRDKTIFFGLGAIKGVGQAAVEAIIEARNEKNNKKFESLDDFFMSVDLRRVNKKVIESLVKAGAFDEFGFERGALYAGYEKFIERSESERKSQELGQESLFALMSDEAKDEKIELPKVEPWTKSMKLNCEKEVLGFYLTDHPLNGLENALKRLSSHAISDLPSIEHKKKVSVGGIITKRREIITRKGTRMAFLEFEDLTGSVELLVFPDAYSKLEMNTKTDQPVIVEALVEKTESSLKLVCEGLDLLENKFKNLSLKFILKDSNSDSDLEALKKILFKHKGGNKIFFECQLKDVRKKVLIEPDDVTGVQISPQLFEDLYMNFNDTNFVKFL